MGMTFLSAPNVEKTFGEAQAKALRATSVEMQGWRKDMEDASLLLPSDDADYPSLFAVFDGHGGLEVSNLASLCFPDLFRARFQTCPDIPEALRSAFLDFDSFLVTAEAAKRVREIRVSKKQLQGLDAEPASGSTANVVAIYKGRVYCANAGDSRSVLSVGKKAVCLSYDHKPTNPSERARIRQAGGTVSMGRIDGGLNLSRALGDLEYKRRSDLPPEKQKVTAYPDVEVYELTGAEEFILMGCDGVWEKYVDSNQLMVDRLVALREKHPTTREMLAGLLDECLSPKISDLGCDNMTAILIEFG